ncbi:MAG: TonB-dependent receptor [Gammaproteobacteria bacterium]|nr:TonB-dependent receptor [Gammaproteobacteria bacterium]MBU4045299.1 TonB-dependent receptor [Gammaproteobacteria bacterium]
MKQKFFSTALLFAVIPLAQAATDSLDEVVVTATRAEQTLAKTLSHTTVITRKDIENSQAPDVPALLRTLAGVEVYQNGGIGKQHSLFVRGSNSSHTLVLLDGARINSATAGTTQIDQLMLDQIERIEVVRGNVSSLYGSEAIGGAIQIFTRRGKGAPSINGSIGAGSHNTQRASVSFGGETEGTAFNVQLSKFKTEGLSAIDPAVASNVNPDNDGYDNSSVSVNVRHAFGTDHSLSASLFDSDATDQRDNSGFFASATDVHNSKAHIQKQALALESRLGENWQSRVQLSRGGDDTQNFLNGAPDAVNGARFKTTSDLLSWQNTLTIGERNVLIAGLEKLKQQVVSSTQYTRTSRTDDSLYAGYTGNYGAQQVQLNLRGDRYSDFGAASTWLLGYGYVVTAEWRFTASMATAFKAPTLNDLFYPFTDFGGGYSYVGNTDLKPERSRDSELGVHYANGGQRLDLVYFDNRIRDLIVINTLPASTMVNLNEARSDGVELSYSGQFGDTGVKLAATQQNPRDVQTGLSLLRRAKHFSTVGVSHRLGALKVGGEWQHSGTRTDIDINTFMRTELAAYDVANITASYALDKQLVLSARVDNLFDRDYTLAHGYNTPGRTVFVGLNYQH